ncbi:hypothetical protein D3C87_1124870 [compost metagenome]
MRALATGLPSSRPVTQASPLISPSAVPRASLKWTPRLVTSAAVRTYIGSDLPSSAAPSIGEAISTTWKPGSGSGMPTTSKGRGEVSDDFGIASVCAPATPRNNGTARVSMAGALRGLRTA